MSNREVKVYKVNDFDWWAGLDRKSVVDAYNAEWPDEYLIEADLIELSELGMTTLIFDLKSSTHYDGNTTECTFEEYLNILLAKDTKFPCFFASTEW